MKRHRCLVWIAGVAATCLVQGAEPSSFPPPDTASGISGTVRDSSGAPAAGVLVLFHPGHYWGASLYAESRTDQNGRYELALKRQPVGFFSGPVARTNFVLARDPGRNLAAIHEFDTIPTNLDLSLQPGITLAGFVKDTDGSPITTATVEPRILSGSSITPLFETPVSVDEQGAFSIPGLPRGRQYNFFNGITAKGYGTAWARLTAEDSNTDRYEFPTFVLKRADRILAGTVLGPADEPLVGATVRFNGRGQPENLTATSDAKGEFRFETVCEGEIQLSAFLNGAPGSGEFMSTGGGLGAKAQAGNTNIILHLSDPNVFGGAPVLRTIGTVLDPSGKPVFGAQLAVWRSANPFLMAYSGDGGKYSVRWQPSSGPKSAPAFKPSLVARSVGQNLAATHDLDDTITQLDLHLQPAFTLSGEVKDAGGQPITNASVDLHMTLNRAGASLGETKTDVQGAFSFRALPPQGIYHVRVDAIGYAPVSRLEPKLDPTQTNRLILPTITLAAATLPLSGTVVGPDGQPVPEVWVNMGGIGQSGGNAYTDTNGRFSFKNVAEGPLRVSASPSAIGTRPAMTGFVQTRGGDTNIVLTLQTR